MTTLSFDPTSLGLTMILQVVWGFIVKRVPALAPWPNKLIPLMNAIFPALIAWVSALAGVPAAHAQGTGAGAVAATVLNNPLIVSYLSMILTTGHHSFLKNTWQWIKSILQVGTAK